MDRMSTQAADASERQAFFERAREQLEQLRRDDPEDWAAYRAESHTWQAGTDRDGMTGMTLP